MQLHNNNKTTLVIGASLKEERFSNICIKTLVAENIPVHAIGILSGTVAGVQVQTGFPDISGIHTVSLYITPENQKLMYNYIIGLHPERVVFNPGTENPELKSLLALGGILAVEDCTLMMVEGGRF